MSLNFRNIKDGLQSLLTLQKPVKSRETFNSETRIYHYLREDEFQKSRIHLRIDPDGAGTLIVNASSVMLLNPTAALMAYLILEEIDEPQAVKTIQQKYNVSKAQASKDLSEFRIQISELVNPDGACLIHDLELETTMPFSSRPSAPYRMDLAITYRCNNDCAHCYNLEHPPLTPLPSPTGRGERGEGRTGYRRLETGHRQSLGARHSAHHFHRRRTDPAR